MTVSLVLRQPMRLLALAIALSMTACAYLPEVTPSGGDSAGDEIQDSAPLQALDPAQIKDAVPRAESLSKRGNHSPYTVNGQTYYVMENYRGFRQRGTASWYGTKFQGRLTSSGEPYDLYKMTAAHRNLPLPVYVKVTNVENGRTAIVRVNDRGPFRNHRIIDLSYAAAVKLGFVDQGTALVEIEVLDTHNTRACDNREQDCYYLQTGAFSTAQAASQQQQQLEALLSYPVEVVSSVRPPYWHRVRLGPFVSEADAIAARQALSKRLESDSTLASGSIIVHQPKP